MKPIIRRVPLPNAFELSTKTDEIDIKQFFSTFNRLSKYHTDWTEADRQLLNIFETAGLYGSNIITYENLAEKIEVKNGIHFGQEKIMKSLGGKTHTWQYTVDNGSLHPNPYIEKSYYRLAIYLCK